MTLLPTFDSSAILALLQTTLFKTPKHEVMPLICPVSLIDLD